MKNPSPRDLHPLEEKLGVHFKNADLLLSALTHPSYLNENPVKRESYQRLEFLGDAVLEFVTSEYIYYNFTDIREGELTEIRAALVRTETLAECAVSLGLSEHIYLSKGEELNLGRKNKNILADCFEAFLGALYLDQGLKPAEKIFKEYVAQKLDHIIKNSLHVDPKSRFQELTQSRYKITPVYKLLEEQTVDNETIFTMGLYVGPKLVAKGSGKNKKLAEHQAAVNALGNTQSS
jgi:ribonuclease-3